MIKTPGMYKAAHPYWMLLAAAVLFSTGGAAIKACSLTSWQVAGFRSGLAAAALVAFFPQARGRWDWRITPVALASAATLLLFVVATKNTTSANAIFLQATGPLYVLAAGTFILGERLHIGQALTGLLIALGMILFYFDSTKATALAPNPALGNLLAALSGATWGATVIGLRWLSKNAAGGIAPIVLANVITFLAALPMALPLERLLWTDALILLYLGVVQIGLAYVLMTKAMYHVDALGASLILLAELALNPVWSWLVHGEVLSRQALAGGSIILVATLGHTIWSSNKS